MHKLLYIHEIFLKSREDVIIELVHGLIDDEQHNGLYDEI